MKVILEEYLQGIAAAGERIARCEAGMRDLLEPWRRAPAVRALMAMKGFQTVAAMILVSELGEVHRFNHPRQVMAYLGLVPTEDTSSDKRRQGHITKCGNSHLRWLLVECAQHYATPPKVSSAPEPAPGRSTQGRCARSAGARSTACTIATPGSSGGASSATRRSWRSRASSAVLSGSSCAPNPVTRPNLHLSDRVDSRGTRSTKKEEDRTREYRSQTNHKARKRI